MVKKFELFEKKLWKKKKIWKNIFLDANICQAKSGVISKSLYKEGVRGPKIKVAQSGVKHGLV